jgi:hypothetical protein
MVLAMSRRRDGEVSWSATVWHFTGQEVRMNRIAAVTLVSLLLAPAVCLAQEPSVDNRGTVGTLSTQTLLAERLLQPTNPGTARLLASVPAIVAQQQPASRESWARRHPVVVGLLIGAGAGAALGAATCNRDNNCDMPRGHWAALTAAQCAGFGALTGWIVSLVRR